MIASRISFCLLIFVFSFATVLNAQITVAGSSIADGNYLTLAQAFSAINSNSQTGRNIVITITANTTETTTAVLNAGTWTTLNIYPTISGISISGSLAAPVIDLNGADNVIIDGRVNASGSTKDLIITNNSISNTAGTSTIRLINDASNNILRYCTVRGSTTNAASGILLFSTTTATTGNDGNLIDNNNLTNSADANRPFNAVYSAGTAAKENSGNTIINNNLYDFLNRANSSYGINLAVNTTAWTISDNSFYETNSFTASAGNTYNIIQISTTGINFTVGGNYIGGKAPLCGSTAWTKTNTQDNPFTAIYLNAGATTPSSIHNNTIRNISWSNSGASAWTAINIAGGDANIGTTSGNTIGATTGTGSITITAGATAAGVYGINITGTGTINCQNNIIGSITAANSNATFATNIFCINKAAVAGTTTISNNTIGSTTTVSSIYSSSASTANAASSAQTVYGIYSSGTGTITISGNTISYLRNGTTNTRAAIAGLINGITSTSGTNTISNNTISNLTIANRNNSTTNTASVCGIALTGNTLKTITGNNLYNLSNSYVSFAGNVTGIYFTGSTGANIVSQNFIRSFSVTGATSTGAFMYGIKIASGAATYSNNIITLGGTSRTTIYGIYETGAAGNNNNLYYNTIYLGGSMVAGATNRSYALYSAVNTNSRNFRNNILVNARSTVAGTNRHYAIYIVSAGGTITCNYNDYWISGTGGTLGFFGANRTLLPIVTGQDANSKAVNPAFATPGGTIATDYIPSNATLLAVAGTGILTDYPGITRSTSYPAMGAFEITIVPSVEVYKSSVLQAGYSTLKNAFDAINSGTHNTGALEIRINNNTTESASAVLNASGSGSADYASVLIYPTSGGVSISGNLASPLINLNGADNVTIDGRVNATGSFKDMTIINTNNSNTAATSAIRFINDATNNTIKYCTVKGSSTLATSGVIFFSTATGTGNDGNIIDNNNITSSADASRPLNAVYSAGTAARENSGNTISNNNFYDFFSRSTASYGINLAGNTTAWTISSNSFYETASFISTASVTYIILQINNTSGTGFTITGNYIGGSAPLSGGTAWTKSGQNTALTAINLNVGTATPSSIQNNIIRNISWSNSAAAAWTGINVAAGDVNIGTTTGNTIGAITGTGSIVVTSGATNANFYGINISGTGSIDCQNNNIGSVTVGNASANASNFYGINKTAVAGTTVISNNLIGSTLTANSIESGSACTGNGEAQIVIGINNQGTGTITISNNNISNLKNSTTNSSNEVGRINGIASADGTNTINNNTIHDLTIASDNSSLTNTASASGISLTGATLKTVTGNTIYNLSNSFASFPGSVIGIYFTGSAGLNVVSQNFIHSLTITGVTPTAAATVYGIKIASGAATYFNNIITLGGNSNIIITGIFEPGAGGTNNLYFNTVYIGGAPTSGARNSHALYNNANTNTRNFRNNIFQNARSNNGSTGRHYAIYITGTTGLTINYNDYFATGTGGVLGFLTIERTTIAAWRTATGQDVNSLAIDPLFSTPGGILAINYYALASLPGVAITGITTDYFGETRDAVPKMGALETQNYFWQGGISTDFATAGNWTGGVVPPGGSDISFATNPSNHCVLDQNRTIRNIINAQGTDMLVLNARQLTLTGNLVFSGGAQINASSASSIIIFSGSLAQLIPAGCFYNNEISGLTINNINNVLLYGTLKLKGPLAATSGKLNAYTNTPSIEYVSGSDLSIPAGIFLDEKIHSLTISNNSGITLNSDFTINNALNISSGAIFRIGAGKTLTMAGSITNSAGNTGLVILSDASGTGSLLHNTNNVAATVHRYFSGAAEDWHFLSSPVSNQSISGFWLPAGTYGNGTGYDLYVWDETTNCWIYKLNTTPPVNWNTVHPGASYTSGRGYLYSLQAANPTKEFTGSLNNGSVTYGLTVNGPEIDLTGFNLVGNPYPSSVDWSASSGWTRSNLLISGTGYDIWIWNPAANNYGVFNSDDVTGIGTNGATRYISPMQGFFVLAETTGNLGFSNSVRLHNGAGNWMKKGNFSENSPVSIKVISEEGNGSDEVQLQFGSEKNNPGAMKLFSHVPSAPSLYFPVEKGSYTVRYLTDTIDNPVIPIMFKPGKNGRYNLQCKFDTDKFIHLILEDCQNHYYQDLKINNTYTFRSSTEDDKARFILHFTLYTGNPGAGELPAELFTSGNQLIIDLERISGESEMMISDVMGRVLAQQKLQGETRHELNLNSKTQMIIVCLKNHAGIVCRKLMWISR